MPVPFDEPTRRDLDLVGTFLARRDVEDPAGAEVDVVVLCGSAVLPSLDAAAAAVRRQPVPRLVVTGGVGHSTPLLRDAVRRHARAGEVAVEGQGEPRGEAAIIADLLIRDHGVAPAAITLEPRATNCGENAEFALAVLARDSRPVRSILLIQDPTMQRRTHAGFARRLAGTGVTIVSHAPFVPRIGDGPDVLAPDGSVAWSRPRYLGLLAGEMRRLTDDESGYGPRGANFIDHVDIPAAVAAAHRRLGATYDESSR